MALTVSSILQYKHFQEFRGQEVLNIQYYRVLTLEGPTTTLSGFAEPLFDRYVENLAPFQSTGLTHTKGELYEVNGIDFDTFVPTVPPTGALAGDTLPPFNAVSIQQVRQTRATRHGWKRIAGITEAQQDDGILLPGVVTGLQTAAEELWSLNPFVEDPNNSARVMGLQSIIWGGNDVGFPLGRYSGIAGFVVNPEITSQNTRKIGRGS